MVDAGDTGSCACKQPDADEDNDGIPDGVEGCCIDSDGDKIFDFEDYDSDGDSIYDALEAGPGSVKAGCGSPLAKGMGWPCDTDGDGVPDYLDQDSDNDKLLDSCEDLNGDGELGCCLSTCGKTVGRQKDDCPLAADGCGPSQSCAAAGCSPASGFGCSSGETDRMRPESFADGIPDAKRGTSICRDTGSCGGNRRVLTSHRLVEGDWQLATPPGAGFVKLTVPTPAQLETAAAVDFRSKPLEVAGFVVSRPPWADRIEDEVLTVLGKIATWAPSGLSVLSSGTEGKSHDCFSQVQGVSLQLDQSTPTDLTDLRTAVVALLLGKQQPVTGAAPFGVKASQVVLRLAFTRRFDFKKDANGNLLDEDGVSTTKSGKCPADSGDATKRRLLITGALVQTTAYFNSQLPSRTVADDLTDGTSLAGCRGTSKSLRARCSTQVITTLPTADILWVVDEGLVQGAGPLPVPTPGSTFFSHALSSGLDFRIGVTGMPSPSGPDKALVGKLCSQVSTVASSDGGTDRLLLPSEHAIFTACFGNPPGSAAADSHHGLNGAQQVVKRHLPRAPAAPDRIRTDAALAVILLTDRAPQSLAGALDAKDVATCRLTASAKQAAITTAIKPALTALSGSDDPEARARLYVIGGGCSGGCGAEVAHGYRELAWKLGGLSSDVCAKDLGAAALLVIDAIAGQASPLKLPHVPISASLAVTLDGAELPRSRVQGFDYRPASNSIVLINTKLSKGSAVVIAYRGWYGGPLMDECI